MAITVDNPVTAVLLFFVAVILVIIGTYFIFMAGSIAVLKFLRKRKVIIIKEETFCGSLWSYLPDETECSRTGKHLYFIHDGTGGNFFNGKYVCRTG